MNGNLVDMAREMSGGEIAMCEKVQGAKCDYLRAAQTKLSDCCINAFIKAINQTSRDSLINVFNAAFQSNDPNEKGQYSFSLNSSFNIKPEDIELFKTNNIKAFY